MIFRFDFLVMWLGVAFRNLGLFVLGIKLWFIKEVGLGYLFLYYIKVVEVVVRCFGFGFY